MGMILGVRLWYGFYSATLASEEAFKGGTISRSCAERWGRKATHTTSREKGKKANSIRRELHILPTKNVFHASYTPYSPY